MTNFYWKAIYNDNSELSQFTTINGTIKENRYEDIDRNKLVSFELWATDYDFGFPVVRINLDLGQRLIFRRRVRQTIGKKEADIFYLVGWQQTIYDQNVQSILCVFDDGHVEMIGKWREDNALFSAATLHDEEK